ncbi:hypothetical protein EBS02_08220 [bacterium]|nr:hypothetical protein [bacterium]
MEIVEIISYYYHKEQRLLEVSFRLNIDSDDEIRNDTIDLEDAKNIGFELLKEEIDLFFEEDDSFEDSDDFVLIDEGLLFSYLNEYYVINPNKLPKSEFF